jgi:hypothetical protein
LAWGLHYASRTVREARTPGHPFWRTLRWLLAALAAWWLLWILLRGVSM